MMLLYSKIIGGPVAEIKTQSRSGEIADLFINNEDLSVAGIIVKIHHLFMSDKKVVNSTDIVQLLKDGAIIRDSESLCDIEDLIRLKKLYENKSYGLSQKVITKSGQFVGRVYDYMIDSTTMTIRKFYVKKLISEVIIPTSKVIEMEGKTITIKEDKNYCYVQPVMETATPN